MKASMENLKCVTLALLLGIGSGLAVVGGAVSLFSLLILAIVTLRHGTTAHIGDMVRALLTEEPLNLSPIAFVVGLLMLVVFYAWEWVDR